jgi:hypothetical protein
MQLITQLRFRILGFQDTLGQGDFNAVHANEGTDWYVMGWLLFGVFLLVFGLLLYSTIFWKAKSIPYFRNLGSGAKMAAIISYIPEGTCRPWLHIAAGISSSIGLCILIGSSVAFNLLPENDASNANATSIAAFIFTIIISALSIWTLWQTRKIDHDKGYNVIGFLELIEYLNKELDVLRDDLSKNGGRGSAAHHRVYMVTTNPLFGQLSYPTLRATKDFADHLRNLAMDARDDEAHERHLRFEILCGTREAIKSMHDTFYSKKIEENPVEGQQLSSRKTAEAEAAIQDIAECGPYGSPVIYRLHRVPPTQFMIVGNKVFEFILEPTRLRSEIHNTEVHEDSRTCDKYIKTFNIFKDLGAVALQRNPIEEAPAG